MRTVRRVPRAARRGTRVGGIPFRAAVPAATGDVAGDDERRHRGRGSPRFRADPPGTAVAMRRLTMRKRLHLGIIASSLLVGLGSLGVAVVGWMGSARGYAEDYHPTVGA